MITWTEIYPPGGTPADQDWKTSSISTDGKYILAGTWNGTGDSLYLSSDFGSTWAQIYSGSIADVSMSSDGKYILMSNSTSAFDLRGRLYLSSNYGSSWTEIYPPGGTPETQDWGSTVNKNVSISANGKYMLAVTTDTQLSTQYGTLYLSSDFGSTWAQIYSTVGYSFDIFSISADGKYILAGSYQDKVYFSSNYGITWVIAINEYYYWDTSSISADGKYILAGRLAAVGTLYLSSDFGSTWAQIFPPEGTPGGTPWYTSSISANGKYMLAGGSLRLYLGLATTIIEQNIFTGRFPWQIKGINLRRA